MPLVMKVIAVILIVAVVSWVWIATMHVATNLEVVIEFGGKLQ